MLLLATEVSAANYTWDGSANDWTSAHWLLNGVTVQAAAPGVADTATINSGTVTVSTAVNVDSLNFTNGIVTGGGTLMVSGTLTWSSGTMSGTGTTAIAAGGTFTIAPGSTINLSQRTLSNAGTGTWVASQAFQMSTGAIFNNSGSFDCQNAGGNLQFQTGGGSINNSGTFKKTTGANTVSINNTGNGTGTFNNTGTVSAQSGTLAIDCGGTGTGGTYTATGSGTLALGTGGTTLNLDAASTINGSGTINFADGTINMLGTYNVAGTSRFHRDGQFDGNDYKFGSDVKHRRWNGELGRQQQQRD